MTVSRPIIHAHRFGAVLILVAVSSILSAAQEAGRAPVEAPAPASETAQPEVDHSAAEESPEQVRRRELTEAHGAEVADAILAGNVLKEMTMAQVLLARGAPTRKEMIPPDAELWHYPAGEVAFSGGKVSYVSLTSKPAPPPAATQREAKAQGRGSPDRSGQEPPGQVSIPLITVGDSYVYESVDPDDPESSVSTRRTVTATKGKVVLSSLNLDTKRAKARSLYFDREWNLSGSRSPDGSGRDYSPPLKYYDFPLVPGKTWQQTTTETNIETGAVKTHTVSGEVGQWETVSVPAGTFRGIRVHLLTELFDPSTGDRIRGTDTSWYVPEVRRSVKSVTTGKDGKQRLIQLISYELGR
jgi:hypothetical protein